MSILGIGGPDAYSIQAAYRPNMFLALTDTDPVVYCDVYFEGVYYRTVQMVKTSSALILFGIHEVDIQTIAQEYIKDFYPDINYDDSGSQTIYNETDDEYHCQVKVFCRFRGSSIDGDGIITPGGLKPIQGTFDSDPVEGDGLESDVYYIVNATLQSEANMDLRTELGVRRYLGDDTGLASEARYLVNPLNGLYDMTNRPRERVYYSDCVLDNILIAHDGLFNFTVAGSGSGTTVTIGGNVSAKTLNIGLRLCYSNGNTYNIYQINTTDTYRLDSIYALTGNIDKLLLHAIPVVRDSVRTALRLPEVTGYRITLGVSTTHWAYPIYISHYIEIVKIHEPHVRIWFKNYYGQLEAVNFRIHEEELKVLSGEWERPLSTDSTTSRNIHQVNRFNARSNEILSVSDVFKEDELEWLKELFGTSLAYVERSAPSEVEGQYMLYPIRIVDASYETRKHENRFEYVVNVKFEMSQGNILLR